MTAEQGKDARTGGVPALNIERIYSTTVPAEELAQALADHFRAQEFEAQVFRASGDRRVMQARKESLWRNLLGVAYALTVVFTPGEGQLSIAGGEDNGQRVGDPEQMAPQALLARLHHRAVPAGAEDLCLELLRAEVVGQRPGQLFRRDGGAVDPLDVQRRHSAGSHVFALLCSHFRFLRSRGSLWNS